MPGLHRRPSRARVRPSPASVNLQAGDNVCMSFSRFKTNVGSSTKVLHSVVPRILGSGRYSRQSQLCSQKGVN